MDKDVQLSTFGTELVVLYRRANLSQSEFATLVGISPVALRKWESGRSCPKTESLKSVIEVLIHKGVFKQGAEQTEALHLWELAMQKGLKIPFDEVWFVEIMARVSVEDMSNISVGADRARWGLPPSGPYPEPYADLNPASSRGLTLVPTRTRRRSKGLQAMLIALVILLIIGSAGTLFFFTRNQATDQTYPGYLSGQGTLAFFDPLNQERGSEWNMVNDDLTGRSCQFTGGAYHANIARPGNRFLDVCYPRGIFSNFALEVQLTITQGDCGGLLFRADNMGHYYYFLLCEQGWYQVEKSVSSVPDQGKIVLFSVESSAIHKGLGQQNKMAVVANGNSMSFYVNEQKINHMTDNTYITGTMGLLAYEGYGNATDVAYSNARLWTL